MSSVILTPQKAGGRLMALSKYLELAWRKKNSLARRYLHFPIALLAQFDLDRVPTVSPRQFEMHERANPLDMTDNGLDGRSPITVAFDLDIIGAHITHGRDVLSIGVLWNLDFELPQACLSGVDTAMEKVDIPQEMVDEGCSRMIIHFLWRANLLRPALVHDHHTIRHLQGLFLIVCDEDTRDMHLVMQTAEPASDAVLCAPWHRVPRKVHRVAAPAAVQRAHGPGQRADADRPRAVPDSGPPTNRVALTAKGYRPWCECHAP